MAHLEIGSNVWHAFHMKKLTIEYCDQFVFVHSSFHTFCAFIIVLSSGEHR